MKIAVFDSWNKFSYVLVDWWRGNGHQVQHGIYYEPAWVEWADLSWFDVADNNVHVYSRNPPPKRGIVVCRPIDIDIWTGGVGAVRWEHVDHCLFIAPHLHRLALQMVGELPCPVHVIPPPVDLSRWTFRERGPGPKIACISHMWSAKGLPLLAQVMAKLGPDYELHTLGTWSTERWLRAYFEHIVSALSIRWTHTEGVASVDAWLEDKNFLLHASQKEGFCYAVAEALAKGIKAVVHNFYGAEAIWPHEILWNTVDEAVALIKGEDYNSPRYREMLAGFELEYIGPRIDRAVGIV